MQYSRRSTGDAYPLDEFDSGPRMPVWKEVLLWIAVLPGMLLGSVVAHAAAKMASWLSSSMTGDDSWFHGILSSIIPNAAAGYAFVFCAAYIAPRGKNAVAVVAACVGAFLASVSIIACLQDQRWLDLAGAVAAFAAAVVAVISIWTGEQKL